MSAARSGSLLDLAAKVRGLDPAAYVRDEAERRGWTRVLDER